VRTELEHERSGVRISIVELPAVNTPQFDWARTHMTHQPRPMGRVYQPEAAADAVFRAAHGHWREYWLGRTTLETILANMLAPSVMDRYLARTAFEGQARAAQVSPDRQDNLFQPVGPLHRTNGAFTTEAHTEALMAPGPVVRAGVVALGAALLAGAAFALGAGRAHRAETR
jgi:hypothetical protein